MKRALIALTIITALFAGCGGDGDASTYEGANPTTQIGTEVTLANGSYWRITPAQLYAMGRADLFLVCVDEQPSMIISGNTNLFVKYNEVSQNLDRFPTDKNQRIVVYCIAGITSQNASEALVTAGYTKVMHLSGGTIGWNQQGYPVTNYTGAP